MKALIVYYSRKGHVRKLANKLKGDLLINSFEVTAKKPYKGYFSSVFRVHKELKKKINVEFNEDIIDISSYDVIIVGFPIWFGLMPSVLYHYLINLNLANKIIIPFSNSGGTNISSYLPKLTMRFSQSRIIYPYSSRILKKDDYNKWVNNIKELIR